MELSEVLLKSLDYVFFLAPIVFPIGLTYVIFKTWVSYVRDKFLSSQEYVLLRIMPPRDVFKTPMAMELFIGSLYQTGGEGTPIAKYWHGKVRAWFSLEIVSNGGEVGFYIWTRKSLSNYIQSQIYAEYPGIEVFETQDYTDLIDFESGDFPMFGAEFGLSEPDAIPIKTYIDYGLDKTGEKDEYKVDPIVPTIEFLASLKPGEFGWIQLIVRAHKKEDKDKKTWFGKTDKWKDDAKDIIIKIKEDSVYKPGGDKSPINLSTKGQQEKINAIERSLSKLPFDTGVRLIYVAKKESFNASNIGNLMGVFRQFGSPSLNSFKPQVVTDFDYWWQDPFGKKVKSLKKNIFDSYVSRDYFWKNLPKGKPRKKIVLNSEELATIYHFPGSVAQTSSLTRTQSKKGEAPPNLPI